MKAGLLVALVLATGAHGQSLLAPAVVVSPQAHPLAQGQPAPEDGVFLATDAAIQLAQKSKQCALENADYQTALVAPQGLTPGTAFLLGEGLLVGALGFVLGWLVFKK